MAKKRTKRRQDYTAAGIVAAVLMTVVTVILGMQAVKLINPPSGGTDIAKTYGPEGWYLVYRSYYVADRGDEGGSEDDTVTYEFMRFPLDGSALVSESVTKIERGGTRAAAPWMSKVDDRTLLFARRTDDAVWTDVSGSELRALGDHPDVDVLWTGLPSPDGSRVAFFDAEVGAPAVVAEDGTRIFSADGPSSFMPFKWRRENVLYLSGEPVSSGMSRSLWRANVAVGEVEEVPGVLELELTDFDLNLEAGLLVGNRFVCDNVETCGVPPSSLHLLDITTGESVELAASDTSVFADVRLSPDASRIAFTVTEGDQSDVWVTDVEASGHERRVTSGNLLDWTPNGNALIVDRDGELQIVSLGDGSVRTIARRSGRYPDSDFHGIDYVGVVGKR
ncbi:hypothetical protein ACFL26_01220 [Patescibacteria group bacterium]